MRTLLIASDNFLPRMDGIAVFLDRVIPELAKSYLITVIAPDFEGGRVWYPGVEVIRVPLSTRIVGDYIPARFDWPLVKELVKRHDVVWTHSAGPIGSMASWYAKRMKKKLVTTVHSIEWELFVNSIRVPKLLSTLVSYFIRMYVKRVYTRADVLLVSSMGIKTLLEKQRIKNKILVVPLGVDMGRFKPTTNKKAHKSALGFDENKKIIIYVGRIAEEKRLLDLLEAYRGLTSLCTLLIVGDGVPYLKRKLKRHRAIVTGFVEDVPSYLQSADIYVIPSSTETSSLSTLEAMSSGLAIVSTGAGGMGEYLKHDKNALLFTVGDVATLKEHLWRLLRDDGLRKTLGEEARRTAKQYSWENTLKKLNALFNTF